MSHRVGVLRGNGIGPEITEAAQLVLDAAGAPIEWVPIPIAEEALDRFGHPFPPEVVTQLKEVRVTLKAPLIVDKLKGRIACRQPDGSEIVYPSLNNAIRRELGLYVNPRPVRGYADISGAYEHLDIVIMREITEDLYIGLESATGDDAAEAVKRITRKASERVARYAFEHARSNGRRRVTCLHKANVLNLTDGLFLRCFREVAGAFPEIEATDLMIDAACYLAVRRPREFDVVVCPNQYGDIFSDLAAGLAGSLGLAPGANIGDGCAVFEASHGAAPDIAGRGIANPAALILSGALLLRHLGEFDAADAVEQAVREVFADARHRTPDLNGNATTQSCATAIAGAVRRRMARHAHSE